VTEHFEDIRRALEQMLLADDAKNQAQSNDAWSRWQEAATDYWVLLHPNLARFRRGDPRPPPSIDELRERAALVSTAMDGIPSSWRLAPPSVARAEHLARVGWFHELLAGLSGPVRYAIEAVRNGDPSGVETLVRFLEADVYCFRSGYLKVDVINALVRASLTDEAADRLRKVVLDVVDGPDRREFRAYVRLAWKVETPALLAALDERAKSPTRRVARYGKWILDGLALRRPGR
jgi:hypothetical protein